MVYCYTLLTANSGVRIHTDTDMSPSRFMKGCGWNRYAPVECVVTQTACGKHGQFHQSNASVTLPTVSVREGAHWKELVGSKTGSKALHMAQYLFSNVRILTVVLGLLKYVHIFLNFVILSQSTLGEIIYGSLTIIPPEILASCWFVVFTAFTTWQVVVMWPGDEQLTECVGQKGIFHDSRGSQ